MDLCHLADVLGSTAAHARIMTGTDPAIANLLGAWIAAERAGDTAALEHLLASEFRGDAGSGRVLTKREWIDKRTGPRLVCTWDPSPAVARRGLVVVHGRELPTAASDRASRRVTVVASDRDGWRIVDVQRGPGEL